MKTTALRFVFPTLFLAGLAWAQPQTVLIPQIADGGGWQTTFVLTNTTINVGSATLTFYQETSGGATQNWNPPFVRRLARTCQCPPPLLSFSTLEGRTWQPRRVGHSSSCRRVSRLTRSLPCVSLDVPTRMERRPEAAARQAYWCPLITLTDQLRALL